MRRRSSTFWLVLAWILLWPALDATSGGTETEQRSGSGWVTFWKLPESPDRAFIREFLEGWEDYRDSQAPPFTPWDVNRLLVGYRDLNDDANRLYGLG